MTTRACPMRLSQQQRTTGPRRQVPLNVIVPLGGLSSNEFTEAGYRLPKPMVPIVGRPMLLWMIDNLELLEGDQIWIGLLRDVEKKYSIKRMLQREFPELKIRVVCFDFETRGPTETLYCILNAMEDADRSRRTISLDSDTVWFCDVLGGARTLPENCGASFYFNDLQDDATAPYSYIRIDDKGRIVDIREKVAISRLANNGAYVFESATSALEGLEGLLDEACSPDQQAPPPAPSSTPPPPARGDEETVSLEEDGVDEDRVRYVSGLIDHMIRKRDSLFLAVLANDFASLGSPAKVRAFVARLRRGEVVGSRPMRFCFGLDGTLLALDDDDDGDGYDNCRPIAKNIAIARELHDAGHTIIIYTDRGMKKRGGAAAAALADVGRVTFAQLEEHGIPCDEVVFGKPHADVYVDAHAVNPLLGDKFEDAIGWDLETLSGANSNSDLSNAVAPRHFNSIRRVGDDHVEKTGPRSVMRGEIHWYQNMPLDLVDLFPQALSVKEHPAQELSSVVMARVAGVTFSHLVVNSCLSPGRLLTLLSSLHRIHTSLLAHATTNKYGNIITDELICSNYRAKVEARYEKHKAVFDTFRDDTATDMYRIVVDALEDYETRKAYKRVHYIHGDPVFSNCMLTGDSKVKLLDMRGALGDTLTTEGDVLYDLSKVYQSLCGYDFIILDVERTKQADAILTRLRDDVFTSWLHTHHPDIDLRDIKMITAAHFYCIIPLHENRHHQKQFLQAAKDIFASLST